MKKIFSLVLVQIVCTFTIAQVGVGVSTPDASAAFQVEALNQGFLAPRVALTSLTDVTTIPTPATGLLVFCSGSAILSNGYYVYNGTKWQPFSQVTNNQDLGYVVGWTSNVNAPDFLLPLNGGTYAWADYPEFLALHSATPSQYISDSNANTFTLVNINGVGRFLRGANSAGTIQAGSTAMPVIALGTSSTGDHLHSIDPPSTGTSTTGNHQHTLSFNNDDYNNAGGGSTSLDNDGGGSYNRYTSWSGDHIHTLDIAAFTSASSGDHTHAITGGDVETRSINTSVVWCIKVKSTSTSGNITIVNQTGGLTGATNGLTHSGAKQYLGGTLTQNTTIAESGFDLGFTGGEVGIGTASPANKLEVASGTTGQSGIRITQVVNSENLGTNASGDLYSITPTYITQRVNAGVPVQLGNLKVQFSTGGNRALQFATTSGTIAVVGSDEAVYGTGGAGWYHQYAINTTLGTSWTQFTGYSFPYQGNLQRVMLTDVTNGITYRISMIVGNIYNNNLIKIERLN